MDAFIKGLIIGFSVAAPVGPIGILCIRRTLNDGRVSGIISGLGAATADTLCATIAAVGLASISGCLMSIRVPIRLAGALLLLYFGTNTIQSKPHATRDGRQRLRLISAYFSTFALTIMNPMTIVFFTAVFAGLGIGTARNYPSVLALVLGAFVGSAFWWVLLSTIVSLIGRAFDTSRLEWVNRIAGAVIIGFALVAFASLVR